MKSANKNRPGSVDRRPASKERPARRPWPLIALGVAGFAALLIVSFSAHRREIAAKPEQQVYSAAADALQPMVVASGQTAKLEPPGIAQALRLFAVTPGSNSREGLAVLGAAEASSRTYVAGALLENGARLTELYADRVVLIRGVKSFTLYLPQKGTSDQVANADTQGLTVGDFPAAHPPLATQPVRVSDAVRVAPVYEGTQISGYSVYPGSRAAQFQRWGLKAGDVLVSLEGQLLTSTEQMESLLDQVAQGIALTGEVRRGEQRVAVTLDGAALIAAAQPPLP
jgi:type II secretion system protein C